MDQLVELGPAEATRVEGTPHEVIQAAALFLRDGMIYHQLYRGNRTIGEMFADISNTLTVMTAESGAKRHE